MKKIIFSVLLGLSTAAFSQGPYGNGNGPWGNNGNGTNNGGTNNGNGNGTGQGNGGDNGANGVGNNGTPPGHGGTPPGQQQQTVPVDDYLPALFIVGAGMIAAFSYKKTEYK